jgi:hypothetical protein
LSAHDGVSFTSIGHSIEGTCDLLLGVHSSCMPKVDPIELKPPPPVRPWPLGHYLWEPFNRPKHSVCLARDDEDFCRQDVCFTATNPPDGTPIPPGVATVSFCGAAVVLVNGMCAPFDANANRNNLRTPIWHRVSF